MFSQPTKPLARNRPGYRRFARVGEALTIGWRFASGMIDLALKPFYYGGRIADWGSVSHDSHSHDWGSSHE